MKTIATLEKTIEKSMVTQDWYKLTPPIPAGPKTITHFVEQTQDKDNNECPGMSASYFLKNQEDAEPVYAMYDRIDPDIQAFASKFDVEVVK